MQSECLDAPRHAVRSAPRNDLAAPAASAGTHHRFHGIFLYVGVAVASVALLWPLLGLKDADWRVPFNLPGDGVYYALLVKTLHETGWVHHNPALSAPFELDLYDFAHFDNLHLAVMKVIGFFTPHWAVMLNAYFVLTFPLTALTALFFFRWLRIHWAIAAATALLFSLHPYHFIRGQGHIMLAAYYLLPLQLLTACWLGQRQSLGTRDAAAGWFKSKRFLAASLICLAASSAGHYYACFGCFFFLVGSIRSSLLYRTRRNLSHAVLLCAITGLGFTLNLSPNIPYWAENGLNRAVSAKQPEYSETYGLKTVQMLLPIPQHRLRPFEKLTNRYQQSGMLGEGSMWLGGAAAIGFFVLTALILVPKRRDSDEDVRSFPLPWLSVLTVAGVLLATSGGFGTWFSYVVSPQIHGYGRMSIWMALFGLTATAWGIHRGLLRWGAQRLRYAPVCAAAVLLTVGLLDQTSKAFIPRHDLNRQAFAHHAEYGAKIMESLPPNTMIFQLPVSSFPFDNGQIGYDHFHLYLHTTNLRWSDPAMLFRPAWNWHREMEAKPADELLPELVKHGFGGILLDCKLNRPEDVERLSRVRELTGVEPLSDGKSRYLFDLRPYAAGLSGE